MALPSREEAFELLEAHTENANLIKHMLAVEAAMRAYARKYGEDEGLWGITGLLHDFDYEKHPTPEEHPAFGVQILEEKAYPEALIHAVKAHAPYLGVPRTNRLDRALFAVDELTGFIVAVTLMQPSRKLADLKVSSVLKKMKRALYSSDDTGHYGLAKKFYAHFTSPIRRYPDLVLHRQLQAFLLGSKLPYNRKALGRISMLCSETEQVAEKAERDVIEIKKYRYLQQQIDEDKLETYDAVVAKVVNFGMFVEVPGLMLQGMVHISAISDKFVRYSRQNQTLRAGSNVYKLGANLRVSPARVDFDKRQIDFTLVKRRRPKAKQRSKEKK